MIASSAIIIYSSGQLSANVVLTGNIKDGELVNADFAAAAAVAWSKISKTSSRISDLASHDINDTDTTLTVAKGGTSKTTRAAHTIAVGNSANAETELNTGNAGDLLTSGGANADPLWVAPAGSGMTLLHAGTGSDNTVANTVVDSHAISGLTEKDTLYIIVTMDRATQSGGGPDLYSTTDARVINTLNGGGTFNASCALQGIFYIRRFPNDDNKLFINRQCYPNNAGLGYPSNETATGIADTLQATTTGFTGNWTIGLRTGGQTAGGVTGWTWAIYKIIGQ